MPGNHILGGPGLPSSLPSPKSTSIISSRAVLLALTHPTLVLPKNSNTALADFSLHSHPTATALSGLSPSAAALAYSLAFSLPGVLWWAGTHQIVISLSIRLGRLLRMLCSQYKILRGSSSRRELNLGLG